MTSEPWDVDWEATTAANGFFHGCQPLVRRGKRQVVIENTPQGRIELIYLDNDRILAAAERLPEDAKRPDSSTVPPDIAEHCARNGLLVWKTLRPRERLTDLLADLLRTNPDPPPGAAERLRHPCCIQRPAAQGLIGDARHATSRHLRAVLSARSPGDPVPLLWGPQGIGKHTVVCAAGAAEGQGIEVSLGRLLIDRVLQTPPESLLDFMVAARDRLAGTLTIFSGAEWLTKLSLLDRFQVLAELRRLARPVLVADHDLGLLVAEGYIPFACPGLGHHDCAALLRTASPRLEVAEAAVEMLARAAWAPGFGVNPGRLLLLARLAASLAPGTDAMASVPIRPDDVAPALSLLLNAVAGTSPDCGQPGSPPFDRE